MEKRDAQNRVWRGMTWGEIAQLLERVPPDALQGPSVVNRRLTKTQAYDMFRGTFTDATDKRRVGPQNLAAVNVLREFGEYDE